MRSKPGATDQLALVVPRTFPTPHVHTLRKTARSAYQASEEHFSMRSYPGATDQWALVVPRITLRGCPLSGAVDS